VAARFVVKVNIHNTEKYAQLEDSSLLLSHGITFIYENAKIRYHLSCICICIYILFAVNIKYIEQDNLVMLVYTIQCNTGICPNNLFH